ncbi:MAG: CBS domain-containing protein [Planctomycetota bacterium]|jgi:CBS domain-containing protein
MESKQLTLIDLIEDMCSEKDVYLKPMRVAQDIMNVDVKTLTLDHTVNQCIKFMESRRVRHVPIVDLPYEGEQKPYFIGIVSQRDVLRINAPDTTETGKRKTDHKALRQLLVQIVARKPVFVSPQTSAQDVITTMLSNHIDIVPVLNDGDLAGIITTTDFLKLFFKLDKVVSQLYPAFKKDSLSSEKDFNSSPMAEVLFSWIVQSVQKIMAEEFISLEPQDNIARAIEVMQNEEIRHILIKDEQGKFLGLISDRDILRNLPFPGRRPALPPKRFREHLFAIKSKTKCLELPLDSIMKRKMLHITPDCSIFEAVDILCKKKISCLPVIDKQDNLRGILTVTDLMRALLAVYEPAKEANIIQSQSSTC